MKVVIVEPGKYPYQADIEDTLEAEQKVVGGMIEEVYPWTDRAVLVCNENGRAENLPLNRKVGPHLIRGTFFICSYRDGDYVSLDEKQVEHYIDAYWFPEMMDMPWVSDYFDENAPVFICTPDQYERVMTLNRAASKMFELFGM